MKLSLIVPAALMIGLVAVGCAGNKKSTTPNAMAANTSALDVPAVPPAPAATFTPAAQQPVIADAPQQPTASIADAPADEIASSPAPQRAPRARTASATTGGTKYKIKKGESLWSIAQSHYGNGNKWKAIAAANPKLDPNKIQAGQTIVLP